MAKNLFVENVMVFKYNGVVIGKVNADYDLTLLPDNLREHAIQILRNTVEVTLDNQEIKDGWINDKSKVKKKWYHALQRMWK